MHRMGRMALLGLAAFAGCRAMMRAPALPVGHSVVRDQLVIYSDFALPEHHRLIDELDAQRTDLSEKLALPLTAEPIHVYLFRTPESFRAFIARHHPDFPSRRAFFVETDTRLTVYAYWGDRVAEDLRHEVAHGYLHAAVRDLPLWLDEGLAEYFEVPRARRGLNQPHVVELLAELERGWQPDLTRLQSIPSVADMTQRDYAEAWAWVYLLLETTPERRELLQRYLQTLRAGSQPSPLADSLEEICSQPSQTLEHILRSLK